MDIADLLQIGRADLSVDFKGPVSMAKESFCAAYPWVVVAENACVLLISWRIGGYFSQIQVIFLICWLQQYNSIFGVKILLYALESHLCLAVILSDACHYTHALRLDIDFSVITAMASHRLREGVICPNKPFSVPAGTFHCLCHEGDFLFYLLLLLFQA